jgi:ABC-2 type transport system ATP-binding protein
MIEISNLTKRYYGVPAVDSLSLSVEEGEIVGLLGPNGAGKSTTILMTTGLIEPDEGAISIAGHNIAKEPRLAKSKIGYMPEDVGFYPQLTAQENLDFFGRLYEMERAKRKERIDYLLEIVGLEDVTTLVGGYSKGMRQRLGLAKALLNRPPVIILDEPTANLDPIGVADYRRIIRQAASDGAAVLVSSHILSEMSVICSRIALLSRGRLVANGKWEDIARYGGEVMIRVEGRGPLPAFSDSAIQSVTYSADHQKAMILASHDIRDTIADIMADAGVSIRNLQIDAESLEDALLARFREEAAA